MEYIKKLILIKNFQSDDDDDGDRFLSFKQYSTIFFYITDTNLKCII